ncbi:MAG: helix-turn-helix domain-containing protein [Gemmataceae bacterium]
MRLLVQETLTELESRVPYLGKMKGGSQASSGAAESRGIDRQGNPNPTREMPLLVTARQGAKMLSISERTLWALSQQGTIPAVKLGKAVRYSVKVLETWVANQSIRSPAPEIWAENHKKGGRNGNDWQ